MVINSMRKIRTKVSFSGGFNIIYENRISNLKISDCIYRHLEDLNIFAKAVFQFKVFNIALMLHHVSFFLDFHFIKLGVFKDKPLSKLNQMFLETAGNIP